MLADFRTKGSPFPTGFIPKDSQTTFQTMTTLTLNVADGAFGLMEQLAEFDYRSAAQRIVMRTVEIAAVVVAVATYIWLALCLFWEEHGDVIQEKFAKFVTAIETAIRVTHCAGVTFRPVVNRVIALSVDKLYYALADR